MMMKTILVWLTGNATQKRLSQTWRRSPRPNASARSISVRVAIHGGHARVIQSGKRRYPARWSGDETDGLDESDRFPSNSGGGTRRKSKREDDHSRPFPSAG